MKTEKGCWFWKAGKNSCKRGVFNIGGTIYSAHRVAWNIHFGMIPKGLMVCHACDIPLCVNPAHLFLGTASDNSIDCAKKGRAAKKLNKEKVENIRMELKKGVLHEGLAKRFGVARSTITRIGNRTRWCYV